MKIKELKEFAEWENRRIEEVSGKTNEELIDAVVLKIAEEYGEFVNEFLKKQHWQRQERIDNSRNVKEDLVKNLQMLFFCLFYPQKDLT